MIDYFSQNMWLTWLAFSLVCLIIEVASFDFFVTCFAIGGLGAMVGALLGLPLWVQIVLWAFVSLLSILFIRPTLTKRIHAGGKDRVSNADALIGKTGVVIEDIARGGFGYVKIDGDEWRSQSADGMPIGHGERVSVMSRDSIVLTVQKIAD